MPSQSISPGCSRRCARIPVYHRTTAGACRRNIPIPSVPGSGADAIRRCGDSTQGRQDATGFHKFRGWIWSWILRPGQA